MMINPTTAVLGSDTPFAFTDCTGNWILLNPSNIQVNGGVCANYHTGDLNSNQLPDFYVGTWTVQDDTNSQQFTITAAHTLFTTPTNLLPAFTADISDTLNHPGLIAVMTSAIAVISVFWLVQQIKKLFPGQRSNLDERGARRHFARRAYLRDTDDRSERGDYLHEGE